MRNGPEVDDFLDRLRETVKPVIVEGKKDKEALEGLGVTNIVCLNNKPLYKIIEGVAANSKKAIILTDLDREGRSLYGKLRTHLQFLGVEVDNYFREFLFRNTKIRQIEALPNLAGPRNPSFAIIAERSSLINFQDS